MLGLPLPLPQMPKHHVRNNIKTKEKTKSPSNRLNHIVRSGPDGQATIWEPSEAQRDADAIPAQIKMNATVREDSIGAAGSIN